MTSTHARQIIAVLVVGLAVVACSSASPPHQVTPVSPVAGARADRARHPYTATDVYFMYHMIGHHAQAIVMAGWAASHGASPSVRTLAARIINAQRDEIAFMQQWLRNRLQPVPGARAGANGMDMAMPMSGTHGDTLMPGMLTEAQMLQLDQARSAEFDRLFLTFMIQHHHGAVVMVQNLFATAPNPDPRVGLRAGLMNAGEAAWNLRVLSQPPPSEKFAGVTNSDLAFTGHYAIQGNYNGYQVWDITDPSRPVLKTAYLCPASQSDVSVYKNLLFVSGEGLGGRIDCSTEGVKDTVSKVRLRGICVFDISDITTPKYIGNVQTCRGSHTHTVVVDPKDTANVYVYISGSAPVRSPTELPGCVGVMPDQDPTTALFRIEVIKVPLAHPEQAAIVSSPRIFANLVAPPRHGPASADIAELAAAKAKGAFTATFPWGEEFVLPSRYVDRMLDSVVQARQGTGAPTAADSAALRAAIPVMIARMTAQRQGSNPHAPPPGPTQCQDRKSTRLNSSHLVISYAVFCLKKKKN